MKRKNKNGFTLVELLAVIVILAIILVIAVPKIMDVIKDTTKASLESSAKMVAAQVENQYTVAQTLGKEFGDTGSCMEDWAGLNEVDYASCTYEVTTDGTAKVTIKGKGKFKGLYACNATRSSATATEEECEDNSIVGYITDLLREAAEENGLIEDDTDDKNIRYAGSNDDVKNYVEFGNTGELWRIIGVFKVEKASGGTEELVKIVRDEPFKDSEGNRLGMSWDSSASTINNGYGINEWSQSDLKTMLNTYYLGEGTTCTYCNTQNQGTCPTTNDCSNDITPINSTYESMIENVVWSTRGISRDQLEDGTASEFYNLEQTSELTGKECSATNSDESENTNCNDTVERKTEWEGKIGLIYPSDWGYASIDPDCEDITNGYGTCYQSNWLNTGSLYWTMSPYAYSAGFAGFVWYVGSDYANNDRADAGNGVRASLYLKSNVQIIDGDGSKNNPYKLK